MILKTMTTPRLVKIIVALLLASVALIWTLSSISATTTWRMSALPDTGQTTDYTATTGEDSDYSINPPSYTDNGETVTDEVTGLIWQKNEVMTTTTNAAAVSYCDTLTLGSYTDWRLPTSHELYSLVNMSTSNPPLNSDTFTNSVSADYWWSSTQQADGSSNYWSMNAGGGIGPKPEDEALTRNFYVRCVRDDLTDTTQSFTDNGDQTVTASGTSLMWQRDSTSVISMTWTAALSYCEGLTLADHDDWRLPNIKELRSISDDSVFGPSVDTSAFTMTTTSKETTTVYWSSTTRENDTSQAWYVDFYFGLVSHFDKTDTGYVLCTRTASTNIYLPIIFN